MTRQEFLIDELPTTSVTIYPSRAHVVRDIADVKLQPGLNEVSIYGITPAADEHSVQLDGHGAATITDMSVELVANRERFADQFSGEESDSDLDEGDEASDSEWERSHLRALASELKRLRDEVEAAREKQSSANDQMRVLNAFMETINAKHNELADTSKAIATYGDDRARLHRQWTLAKQEIERLEKNIRKKEANFQKETKAERKAKKKQREEKQKRMAQRLRERQRVREEKAKFWPRKLYCVKLTLEAPTDTPTSSRRGSIESAASSPDFDEHSPVSVSEKTVRLSLSYVVREASWSPRYNVSISSVDKTATITYSAEFSNKTSETWKDAKITLSTSQTSYSGLDDKVPELRPWPIFLRDRHAYDEDEHLWDTKLSPQENLSSNNFISHAHGQDHFNRYEVFGPERVGLFGNLTISEPVSQHRPPPPPPAWKPTFGAPSQLGSGSGGGLFNNTGRGFGATTAFGQAAPTVGNNDSGTQQPPATGGLFGNSTNAQPTQGGGLFGGGGNTNAQPAQTGGLFGSSNNNNTTNTQPATTTSSSLFGNTSTTNNTAPQPPTTGGLFGRSAAVPPPPAAGPDQHPSSTLHQEPTWEDSGMTTAYDLPGTRTLAPSPLARRHKLATLRIRDVALSYLAIPKLRKGAFLRAKLRNPLAATNDDDDNDGEEDGSGGGEKTGGITLLAGAAGLTLDGSFLGTTTTLPRTAPGEALELDLGVDPAVHVAYAPPALLRHGGAQAGLLMGAREAADRYARCTTLTNARGARVKVTVRDQVPVSEMERLRVEVVEPRGLWRGGGRVRAGEVEGVEEAEGEERKGRWGEATAEMKEGNVVEWTVELEKGRSCRLPLEWEVRMPGDKRVAFA
ncbi:hypothetical protein SLS54_005876 [Diplodia seriata]